MQDFNVGILMISILGLAFFLLNKNTNKQSKNMEELIPSKH